MSEDQPQGSAPPPPAAPLAPNPAGGGGGANLDLGEVLSEAWELFTRDAAAYILATLAYILILTVSCGLALIIWGPISAGMVIMGFKARKGEQVSFGDAFSGFEIFGPTFLVVLVAGLLILLGTALCILPGLYLAIAWAFALPLVIDRKMDFWDAMQESMNKVNANFVPVLVVILVLYIINSAGGAVAVGVLVTQPLMVLGINVAYEKLWGGLQPGPVI